MGNEEDVEELRLVESVDEEDGILVKLLFYFLQLTQQYLLRN